jgi:hypothetical protein
LLHSVNGADENSPQFQLRGWLPQMIKSPAETTEGCVSTVPAEVTFCQPVPAMKYRAIFDGFYGTEY